MNGLTRRPEPAAARAHTVASFYLAMTLVGLVWHAVSQEDNDIWRTGADQDLGALVTGPLIGVIAGLAVVVSFRWLETRWAWIGALHLEFRGVLGRLSAREVFILAAASSLGEEVLFRGAMMDAWGVWVSTAVFALAHLPPRLALWPWTLSAGAVGLLLAQLTLWTGNLGAAVAAHFVVNLLNLAYITRREPRGLVRVP